MLLTEPVVDPEVGLRVGQQDILYANDTRQLVKAKKGHGQAQVRQSNERGLIGTKDGAGGVEVALAKPVSLSLKTSTAGGGVQEQVREPSEELVRDKLNEVVNRGVLEKLQLGENSLLQVIGASPGDKCHVLLHVAGVTVVAVVRELPGEVGDQQQGVREKANDIIELLVLAEGAVAGLVTEDPDTGADQTLDEAVNDPGCRAGSGVRDLGDEGNGGPAERSSHE